MERRYKAGRELDARVAAKVFGWTKCDPKARWGQWDFGDPGDQWTQIDEPWCRGLGTPPRETYRRPYPLFSEVMSAAWEVAEKLGIGLIQVDDGWMAFVDDGHGYTDDQAVDVRLNASATAETAPHAICLVALKAIVATR